MGAALEAGFDIGALALCFVALALLLAAKQLAQAIAGPLNVSIAGVRPFGRVASAIENGIIGALDDAIKGVEATAAKFESGLIDSFGLLIAIPALLALGTKAALEYLWTRALRPVIHAIADPIRTVADKAAASVATLEGTVAANVGAAERYARERAASALGAAEAYVDRKIDAAIALLRRDISGALSAAEGYADTAVARLRSAEDQAVANAVGLAAEAKAAGLAAAIAAEQAAERAAGSALAQSEAAAAQALAEAQAAGKAALDTVKGIAVGVGDDLATIEGAFGAAGIGALIASIPALATLVTAIAVEAGLEDAACRGKVKGICRTDPNQWAGLLAGLGLLGAGFSLRELAELARPVVGGLADVIREAA